MDHSTQVTLTRELLRHIAAGTTSLAEQVTLNPTAAYTDRSLLALERELLFREYPLLMGLSCQVAEPGDYLTDDFSGVPIVVVRHADGALRAFVNVCRHRGARLVLGSGRIAGRFVCPYHGWSYGLDGRLARVPQRDGFAGLDFATYGLCPLPVAEKHGMIWVRPSPGEAFDIDAHLAGLGAELESYGCAGYHFYESRVIEREMNWKIVIDTFLEPYHFAYLHRDTVGPIFIPNLCLFHPFGLNLRETLPRRSILDLRDRPEAEWDLVTHSAIVYVLFPNTVFIMQADHIETWRVYPQGDRPDRCVMYLDFYIPEPPTTESARRHWQRNMDLAIRTVDQEDFPTGEGVQRGFASGAQAHLTYGRNEPALAHFENAVRAALAAFQPGPATV